MVYPLNAPYSVAKAFTPNPSQPECVALTTESRGQVYEIVGTGKSAKARISVSQRRPDGTFAPHVIGWVPKAAINIAPEGYSAWPLMAPWIAKRAFTPTAIQINSGGVPTTAHSFGAVFLIAYENHPTVPPLARVSVVNFMKSGALSSPIYGWVDLSYIKIGPKDGPICGSPLTLRNNLGISCSPTYQLKLTDFPGKFEKFCVAFLDGLRSQKANIGFLPDYLTDDFLKNDAHIAQTAKFLVKAAADAGTLGELNKPNFTAVSLMDAGDEKMKISDTSKGAMVYLRLYTGLKASSNSTAAHLYAGNTRDVVIRNKAHEKVLKQKKNNTEHYKVARAARKSRNSCLLFIEKTDILYLAEQITVNALETYHPKVTSLQEVLQEDAQVAQANIGANLRNREHCYLMTQVGNAARKRSGFPSGFSRQSFGITGGLNLSTPLAEEEWRTKSLVWTKRVIPGVVEIYRRVKSPVRKMDSATDRGIVFTLTKEHRARTNDNQPGRIPYVKGRYHDDFEVSYPLSEGGPQLGQYCDIIVEIRLDGPHPRSFARLPTLGCAFDDIEMIQRLGIRGEWKDDNGQWWMRYFQQGSPYAGMRGNPPPGAPSGYLKSSAMLNYFKPSVISPRQSWRMDFGVADLREVSIDHLKREIILSQQAKPTTKPPPRHFTPQELDQKIANLGAQRVGGAWRALPSVVGELRTACDFCYVRRTESISNVSCARDGNTSNCKQCVKAGHSCSWTRSNIVNSRPNGQPHPLVTAMRLHSKFDGTPVRINDPESKQYVFSALM